MRIFVIWDLVAPAVRTLVEALPELWPRRPGSPEMTISWCIPGVTATGKEMARDVIAAGVRDAEQVIALVDRPSASVGWQIGLALGFGKSLQLASIGTALPAWTQVGALKGLFTHHLNDVTGMAVLLEPLTWQLPAVPPPDAATQGGATTLVLCPSGPIGSTLREVALREAERRALPEEGWGLYELPRLLAGFSRVVWVLASDGRGAAQDLADNASNGVVAGFAEARGLAVAVLRADDIPTVVDVQPREHRFRNLSEFKHKLQAVKGDLTTLPASAAVPISSAPQPAVAPVDRPWRPWRRWLPLAVALLFILGGSGIGLLLHHRGAAMPAKGASAPPPPPPPIVQQPPPDLGATPLAKSAPGHKTDKHAANHARRVGSMNSVGIPEFMTDLINASMPQMQPAPTAAEPEKKQPAHRAAHGCAIDDDEWHDLEAAVRHAVFQQRWATLAEGTQTRCLTIKQLAATLAIFPYNSDRVRLMKWVGPRVRDPKNAYLLEDQLSYGEEQRVCRELFSCCQASCAVASAQ